MKPVAAEPDWCEPDGCPAAICNGPHVEHRCPNGDLVVSRIGDPTPCPFCGWTGRPRFVVGDVFVIRGRGPVITRSPAESKAARDAGELFAQGDEVACGDLRATITGIERHPVHSDDPQPQGGLLLRGVADEELERGPDVGEGRGPVAHRGPNPARRTVRRHTVLEVEPQPDVTALHVELCRAIEERTMFRPWLAPAGGVDGTVVDTVVFEPPALFANFSVAVPHVQLEGAPLLALDEVVHAAAAQLDEGFRRRISVLRALGHVQVGLWAGLKSKLWQSDGGWHMRGRYLTAAVAIAKT